VAREDRAAFHELFHLTSPRVWRLVRAMISNEARAEEAMQETYAAVWRSAWSFRGESSGRGWLYGVARRQAARSVRRRAGEPVSTIPLERLGEVAGWGQDPEAAAAAFEDAERLHAAIDVLQPNDREVIVLCDLEGLSGREAADILGITVTATRVRAHRARLRLMAALRKERVDS